MQYFSFIGIGPKNGYKDVIYSFEDNSGEEVISHFVQEAIYTKHSKDIEGLYVFATKESRDKYGDSLIEQIGEDKHIEFIEINYEDSFDIYVSKLLEYMKENEEVILDVTHCFRHIPMKLLFALKYIELNKHVNILHLYYGMLQENKDKAIILDFIDDYQQQKLSDLLSQFDRTLVIKSSDVEALVDSTDGRITRFLEALTTFNKMVEYSEFDASIKAISKINNACNGIAKYKESYTLILPIVNSIKSKFKDCEDGNNEVQKKLALIRVLLNHERYQVAITFIDQFLREEIIRITLNPNSYTFNLEGYYAMHRNYGNWNEDTSYNLSQTLLGNVYGIRNKKIPLNTLESCFSKLLLDNQANINAVHISKKSVEVINHFYKEIRNHIQHGQAIKTDIRKSLLDMMECIEQLGRRK